VWVEVSLKGCILERVEDLGRVFMEGNSHNVQARNDTMDGRAAGIVDDNVVASQSGWK
jgi:hypothetical protein